MIYEEPNHEELVEQLGPVRLGQEAGERNLPRPDAGSDAHERPITDLLMQIRDRNEETLHGHLAENDHALHEELSYPDVPGDAWRAMAADPRFERLTPEIWWRVTCDVARAAAERPPSELETWTEREWIELAGPAALPARAAPPPDPPAEPQPKGQSTRCRRVPTSDRPATRCPPTIAPRPHRAAGWFPASHPGRVRASAPGFAPEARRGGPVRSWGRAVSRHARCPCGRAGGVPRRSGRGVRS